MERRTRVEMFAAFVLVEARRFGWTLEEFKCAKRSLSRYIVLSRPGGRKRCVRVSDHGAKWRKCDQAFSLSIFRSDRLTALREFLAS